MNYFYSVIIPFHGNINILDKVLQSLENTKYPNKEVILVSDGVNFGLEDIQSKFQVSLISFPYRRGPSFARNAGARLAKFDKLIFLDSDILIPSDAFTKINDFFKRNQNVVVANCMVSSYCLNAEFFSQYANMLFRYSILENGQDTVFSSFCIIASKPFWEVGGFNQSIPFPFADDVVLGWKLSKREHRFALIDYLEVIHCKKLRLPSFIRWRFLHGYFYGKYYIIYRFKFPHLIPDIIKNATLFLGFIFTLLTLLYFKAFIFFVAFLTFLGLFWGVNFKFLSFLLREKEYKFAFKSILINILQLIVYFIGVVIGVLRGFPARKDLPAC